jgi:hypothetical protein
MGWLDARALVEFWRECPPQDEALAILAQAFTTWRPPQSADDHQRSLEARWQGGAMNAAQLLAAMGGAKGGAVRIDGTVVPDPAAAR